MKPTSPLRIAFYEFRLNGDKSNLGGTGIEFTSMVNFLKAQQEYATVRCIPCPPSHMAADSRWQKLWAFLRQQWLDMGKLLTPDEEILLFVYPKMPFIGHSKAVKVLLFAILGYGLLALKKRLTKQRVVILITDLPVEQQLMVQPAGLKMDIKQELARFHSWRRFTWTDRLTTYLERLLFKQANFIISLSQLMTGHIAQKHRLPETKICLRGRNAFAPTYVNVPKNLQLADADGLRVFYSGDLVQPTTVDNIKQIMPVFQNSPLSRFYLCGQQGEWIEAEAQVHGLNNVHYLGALDYATHDAVAGQCDVGLILYTFAYVHLILTSKYSAYVANGLAILSTDMLTLSKIIREDQVGLAVPAAGLPAQLEQWLKFPEQVRPYKAQAKRLSSNFSQNSYRQDWFDQIVENSV